MTLGARLWSLLLVLVAYTPNARPSVDDSFRDCTRFLYRQQPPIGVLGSGLRRICQRYSDQPRYATLYDSDKRIPLYSAYIFKRSDGEKSINFPWMYEPQLSTGSATGNMIPFSLRPTDMQLDRTQAVLEDYVDAFMYERGQLNPDMHQADPDDKAATYTLTNVVPLVKEFHQGPWSRYLDQLRQQLNNFCHGVAYVVSGVTTAGNAIRKDNAWRVAIPKYMWSAYCCPDFDPNAPYEVRFKFPSFAAYGLNEIDGNFVTEVSHKRLESLIKKEMPVESDFQLFSMNCVAQV